MPESSASGGGYDRLGLSDDFIWALRLARMGNSETRIARALSTKHPRYGYHSVVYADWWIDEIEAARRYATRTATKAIATVGEEPRVGSPEGARQRLSAIWAQVDLDPWPLGASWRSQGPRSSAPRRLGRGHVANFNLDLRTHAMRAGQSFPDPKAPHSTPRTRLDEARPEGPRQPNLAIPSPSSWHISKTFQGPHMCRDERPRAGTSAHHPRSRCMEIERPRRQGLRMVLHLQRSGAALPDGSSGILAALDAAGLNAALDDTELLRRLDLFALDAGPGLYNSGWRDGMKFFYERRQKQAAATTPANLICAEEGR